MRGIIKSNLEDYPGAEVDFTTAIDLYPKLINAYRSRAYTRMAQNDRKGYDEDQNLIDSLMKIEVPEHDMDELSYLQTITDFNNDFTSINNVIDSKVQYADKEIQMIPVFHISVKQDWDIYTSSRFNGLSVLNDLSEKNIYFKVDNYDSEYKDFFRRCLWLKYDIEKKLGDRFSPRQIDTILLSIYRRNLKSFI